MSEQSDTPRTDALMSALKGIVANDNERVSITIVGLKQLEQELSVVKRERDEARAEVERMRKHVAEAVAAERERWRPVLDAVVRELACKGEHRGNAPGHAHSIPGVWDSDNGPIAGTPCSWCTAWKIARELLDAEAIRTRAEKETK